MPFLSPKPRTLTVDELRSALAVKMINSEQCDRTDYRANEARGQGLLVPANELT
jgi:hypothetical protein